MAESEGKSHVRKRKDASKAKDLEDDSIKSSGDVGDSSPGEKSTAKGKPCKVEKTVSPRGCGVMESGSYWLTRIIFTRAIGFIYCMCAHVIHDICRQK